MAREKRTRREVEGTSREGESRIPEVVIRRLPVYARALDALEAQKVEVTSSLELGKRLGVTPAQIRKDLSYFYARKMGAAEEPPSRQKVGFGKQGMGYNVRELRQRLRKILGLEREWPMVLVGVGKLGQAIATYAGFAPQGFRVAAAFDVDRRKIGSRVGSLVIRDVGELPEVVHQDSIEIGIVAVPASQGQAVIDLLARSGVKAILNYAPIAARVPEGVRLRQIDPTIELESLTYYLSLSREGGDAFP